MCGEVFWSILFTAIGILIGWNFRSMIERVDLAAAREKIENCREIIEQLSRESLLAFRQEDERTRGYEIEAESMRAELKAANMISRTLYDAAKKRDCDRMKG